MKTRKQAQRAEMPNDTLVDWTTLPVGAVLEIGRLQANPEAVLPSSTQIAANWNVPPMDPRENAQAGSCRHEDPLPVVRLGKYRASTGRRFLNGWSGNQSDERDGRLITFAVFWRASSN